jgi:hypothetical protein
MLTLLLIYNSKYGFKKLCGNSCIIDMIVFGINNVFIYTKIKMTWLHIHSIARWNHDSDNCETQIDMF